jgi:hypothetical protein
LIAVGAGGNSGSYRDHHTYLLLLSIRLNISAAIWPSIFREMVTQAISDKKLQARILLFDSWYASVKNLKFIHRLGRYFVTMLKSNRKVSL